MPLGIYIATCILNSTKLLNVDYYYERILKEEEKIQYVKWVMSDWRGLKRE
jgi:hypothetical protein